MSKGNMLLSQARGKVGSMVFFVRDGVQQTRVLNSEPKNPRTISQMQQRVKLASVVGFYKRQASFFRFALKKKARESYYNAFVRYNINISPYLTKEEAAAGVQVAAPYIIADGDMPRIDVNLCSVNVSGNLECRTSIASSMTSWGDLRRAYNLVFGDMITAVIFNRGIDNTDQTRRVVSQHIFDAESDNNPIGYDMVGLTWSTMGAYKGFTVDKTYFNIPSWYAAAAAIVVSRNQGKVECSYAQLKLSENAETEYISYRTQEQHDAAAASYGKVEDAILDPKSFEGNYVDMVSLYTSTSYTAKITIMSLEPADADVVYFNPTKHPDIVDCDADIIAGNLNDITAELEDTGVVKISAPENAQGSGDIIINLRDASSIVIGKAHIKVVITD